MCLCKVTVYLFTVYTGTYKAALKMCGRKQEGLWNPKWQPRNGYNVVNLCCFHQGIGIKFIISIISMIYYHSYFLAIL